MDNGYVCVESDMSWNAFVTLVVVVASGNVLSRSKLS